MSFKCLLPSHESPSAVLVSFECVSFGLFFCPRAFDALSKNLSCLAVQPKFKQCPFRFLLRTLQLEFWVLACCFLLAVFIVRVGEWGDQFYSDAFCPKNITLKIFLLLVGCLLYPCWKSADRRSRFLPILPVLSHQAAWLSLPYGHSQWCCLF